MKNSSSYSFPCKLRIIPAFKAKTKLLVLSRQTPQQDGIKEKSIRPTINFDLLDVVKGFLEIENVVLLILTCFESWIIAESEGSIREPTYARATLSSSAQFGRESLTSLGVFLK